MYSWLRHRLSNNKDRTQNLETSTTSSIHKKGFSQEEEEEEEESFYGVTDQLIEFVNSFTLHTFNNLSLPDEETVGTQTTSGGVRVDLSEWQQRHATIILSKVKGLSQLRYTLCPRHLKERQFWRIYFTLVKSYVTEYELNAIRLGKLKQMAMETKTSSDTNGGIELEMAESKHTST